LLKRGVNNTKNTTPGREGGSEVRAIFLPLKIQTTIGWVSFDREKGKRKRVEVGCTSPMDKGGRGAKKREKPSSPSRQEREGVPFW